MPGDSPNIKYRVIIVSISTCTIFLIIMLLVNGTGVVEGKCVSFLRDCHIFFLNDKGGESE